LLNSIYPFMVGFVIVRLRVVVKKDSHYVDTNII